MRLTDWPTLPMVVEVCVSINSGGALNQALALRTSHHTHDKKKKKIDVICPGAMRPLGCLALFAVAVTTASVNAASSVFDIRSYGAVGDGKTMNTAAIATAIAAAHKV